jgi:hypothetical protein
LSRKGAVAGVLRKTKIPRFSGQGNHSKLFTGFASLFSYDGKMQYPICNFVERLAVSSRFVGVVD